MGRIGPNELLFFIIMVLIRIEYTSFHRLQCQRTTVCACINTVSSVVTVQSTIVALQTFFRGHLFIHKIVGLPVRVLFNFSSTSCPTYISTVSFSFGCMDLPAKFDVFIFLLRHRWDMHKCSNEDRAYTCGNFLEHSSSTTM